MNAVADPGVIEWLECLAGQNWSKDRHDGRGQGRHIFANVRFQPDEVYPTCNDQNQLHDFCIDDRWQWAPDKVALWYYLMPIGFYPDIDHLPSPA